MYHFKSAYRAQRVENAKLLKEIEYLERSMKISRLTELQVENRELKRHSSEIVRHAEEIQKELSKSQGNHQITFNLLLS